MPRMARCDPQKNCCPLIRSTTGRVRCVQNQRIRTDERQKHKRARLPSQPLICWSQDTLLSSADLLEPSRKASPTALFFLNITQPPHAIARCSRWVKNFTIFLSMKFNKPIRRVFSAIYLREIPQGSDDNQQENHWQP